ncbi:MAG: glycosyltransferase family 2 protein [Desulfobacterales bacterium]|nr:glycosyltransferase family 2 protein [Desulfobacterales bacterium]
MSKTTDPSINAADPPTRGAVSVILPAYNEGAAIGSVVSRVKALHPGFEIIVIDDGSTDDTAEKAREAGARVYSHPYNIGNGAAIKNGIRCASGDIFVFMDADNQHDPAHIEEMLEFFPAFDMVVGARSGVHQASIGRLIGNKVFNWLASYVTKFPIKDLTSGFRAVKGPIARSFLFLLPNTYSYPTTLTLSVLRSGQSVKYIPIAAQKRQTGKSRINLVRDGVRFFMMITKICTLYSPMRIFLPVSFLMCLLGMLNYAYTFVSTGRFTNMSALLFVASTLIFMMSLISEQISQMRFERRSPERSRLRPGPSKESEL